MQRLFDVSALGDWEGWIEFCLQGTLIQAEDTIQRCERLRGIREDFMKRVGKVGGSVRLNQIVESVFNSPFVRIAGLHKQLEVTYPTAKADIERLVEADILRKLEDIIPITFYAPEVFNVAYEEME